MSVGDRLKRHRSARGLSQAQLADLAGITQAELSRIERNVTLRSRFIPDLAKALECEPHALDPDSFPASHADPTLPLIPIVPLADIGGDLADLDRSRCIQFSLAASGSCIAAILDDTSFNLYGGRGAIAVIDTALTELVHDKAFLFRHDDRSVIRLFRQRPDRMHPATSDPVHETETMTSRTKVIGRVVHVLTSL